MVWHQRRKIRQETGNYIFLALSRLHHTNCVCSSLLFHKSNHSLPGWLFITFQLHQILSHSFTNNWMTSGKVLTMYSSQLLCLPILSRSYSNYMESTRLHDKFSFLLSVFVVSFQVHCEHANYYESLRIEREKFKGNSILFFVVPKGCCEEWYFV